MINKIFFITLISLLFYSCENTGVFEQTKSFPLQQWSSAVKPTFTFNIEDTAARYNIFVVLRHTDAYHFNNLWLNITTIAPKDTAQNHQVKLILANNAKWLGTAMDDVIESRILITKYPVKLKAGNYTFILQQIMREDPLQKVLQAGVRVEKAL